MDARRCAVDTRGTAPETLVRKGPILTLAIVIALLALSRHAEKQTAELPDLRGMTLRSAQLTARDAGFHQLSGTDALDRHRIPLIGTNWRVCSQQPPPARHSITTPVTVRVVKSNEACPNPVPSWYAVSKDDRTHRPRARTLHGTASHLVPSTCQEPHEPSPDPLARHDDRP